MAMPIVHRYNRTQETLSNYECRDKQIIQSPMCSLLSISEGGSGLYIAWPQSSALDRTPVHSSWQHPLLWEFSSCLSGQVTWGYSLNTARLLQSLKHPSMQAVRRQCGAQIYKSTFETVVDSYYWYLKTLHTIFPFCFCCWHFCQHVFMDAPLYQMEIF